MIKFYELGINGKDIRLIFEFKYLHRMSETIWVAIISAFATIVTAILSLYPEILRTGSGRGQAGSANRQQNKKVILRLVIVCFSVLLLAVAGDFVYRYYKPISSDEFDKMAEENATNPYLIESVTAVVKYDDSLYNGQTKRHTYVRIIYVLKLLKDIAKDDEKAFVEEYYGSETKPSPEHWYGTEKEAFTNDNGSKYSVMLEGKKGDVITVVTGATYTYPMPLADKRITPKGSITITGKSDYYAYQNDLDYIKNLTIVLESNQIDLLPWQENAAFTVIEGSKPVFEEVTVGKSNSPNRGTSIRQKSISMHWKNVSPGTYNGIIYQWE